jgi:hypothetical protein
MIDGIPNTQLVAWFEDALDRYPVNRRSILARLRGKPWDVIRKEIVEAIMTNNRAVIGEFRKILDLDLIELGVDDTLAVARDPLKLHVWEMLNMVIDNAKLDAYLLYRKFGGSPRFCIGRPGLLRRKMLF